MTRDELIALVATSLSHRPEPVPGGCLFCHIPHVAEFAYLGRIYDPVSTERASAAFAEARNPGNPYFRFATQVANGLRIANISLYGVVEGIDRSVMGIGQPISLRYGNVIERPAGLRETDMVVGGIVGWSSTGAFVMADDATVRLVHARDGADVADAWPSLEAMLRAELIRLAAVHDGDGRELCAATDLMHPSGRRWETEIEPGRLRH
ncbi:MAG TPA: hypothetical protein VMG08_04270 [Allosphingosinicella sp.]|nr:hypothetical protein [Allosphingosinicella sp.]